MAESFHRITHSLRRDHGLPVVFLSFLGIILVSCWLAWAFLSQVARYESSDSARLQVLESAYPIESGIGGQVQQSYMTLGRHVEAGELLAQLDASAEQLSLAEERTRLAAIGPQLEALNAQIQSEQAGRADERRVLEVAKRGALAEVRQAETQNELAQSEARRAAALLAAGVLAPAEADRAATEAQSKRALLENSKLTASQLEPQLEVREREREVRIRELLEQRVKLDSDRAMAQAEVQRLQYEVERRQIRAAIGGELAECPTLPAGSYVGQGQKLGMILPAGRVEIVAEFSAAAAVGKIHPGQAATLRLDGFPWAQYGTVAARVSKVASEIRDGRIRVELAVTSVPHSAIRLEHGAPGRVEIVTEVVSPARLLFRSAGAIAGAP